MQIHEENRAQQNTIRFFDNISYKFDLDHAQLGAELNIPDERMNSVDRCHLQLWACNAPYQGERLLGVKIAETAFVPAHQGVTIFDNVPAMTPAENRDFAMVMTLTSEDQNGKQLIEDYVNFAQRQQFMQPRLGTIIETRFDSDALTIVIDGIENPREQHNLSGDLSLEIWATHALYQGGSVDGIWLGGLNLGQLVGGESRLQDNYRFLLDQSQLPAGCGLVLMLREWSVNGFVTRDYRHIEPPIAVTSTDSPSTTAASEKAASEPAVAAPAKKVTTSKPATQTKAVAVAKTFTSADKTEAPAKAKIRTTTPGQSKPRNEKSAKVAAAGKSQEKTVEAESVSVNRASTDDLLQVKGISANVASKIVEQRPYEKLDDLLRVPGIGAKLLERLKSMLKL